MRDLNWLGDIPPESLGDKGLEVFARVRSTRAPKPALLFFRPEGAVVELLDGEEGVAPGQACVLYADGTPQARVLGGGTIARRSAGVRPAPAATEIPVQGAA